MRIYPYDVAPNVDTTGDGLADEGSLRGSSEVVASRIRNEIQPFGEKIFNLPIDRAEIVLCPGGNFTVQLCRKAKGNLFFLCVVSAMRFSRR